MPFARGRRAAAAEQQREERRENRRSASPRRGVKKSTALVDMTNAPRVHIRLPGRKEKKKKKEEPQQRRVKKKRALPPSEKSPGQSSAPDGAEADGSRAGGSGEAEEEAPAVPARLARPQVPPEFDVDAGSRDDCFMSPEYAKEIFDYLKRREEKFALRDYMSRQPNITGEMRAILVDWLVEVQESFELYHETLYLAVRLMDHFLARTAIQRDALQLVGSTAMLLASKFEERDPPSVDNFLYICDDAYCRQQLLAMEARMLQTLAFDIAIPVAYHFLRRYAKCVGAGMDTLTLARYFCELSLMDAELALERGSLLAGASLLLALRVKRLPAWPPVLRFHSGYALCEVAPLVRKLYRAVAQPRHKELKAVRSKYSHRLAAGALCAHAAESGAGAGTVARAPRGSSLLSFGKWSEARRAATGKGPKPAARRRGTGDPAARDVQSDR